MRCRSPFGPNIEINIAIVYASGMTLCPLACRFFLEEGREFGVEGIGNHGSVIGV